MEIVLTPRTAEHVIGSRKALEKAGLLEKERFLEEERLSVYLEWRKPAAHS